MIFYLCPDHPEPSWGVGMLYEHVALLRRDGFAACVLHHRRPFRPFWRTLDEPLVYLDDRDYSPTADDLLVVPEILAATDAAVTFPGRRIVFVQGSFLVLRGLGGRDGYPDLGYRAAMAVLPHVAHVVERHFGLGATLIPPFVAPLFFERHETERREQRVLLVSKPGYAAAGLPDEPIAASLLERAIARRPTWSFQVLKGMSHPEVARLMRTSELLVNVNSHEAFNSTVPEAMAAGCVPVCYEAVGGRDFLRDGENALVHSNHDVYALVERVIEIVDHFPAWSAKLERLRQGGAATAGSFRPEATAAALAGFFGTLLRSGA